MQHSLPPIFPFYWASAYGQDPQGVWQAFEVQGVEYRLRWIPPGTFLMGSPMSEKGREGDESLHEVTLSLGFWLGETPVTQALWGAVRMGRNPSYHRGNDQYPVDSVSWLDVSELFLRRLETLLPGLNLRLPTEAEFEYAARECGRIQTAYAWGDQFSSMQGNFDLSKRVPVRFHEANALGLYQMSGNILQWVQDVYAPYSGESVADPVGPAGEGRLRVLRGGGDWDVVGEKRSRLAHRVADSPQQRLRDFGFRVARGPFAAPANGQSQMDSA